MFRQKGKRRTFGLNLSLAILLSFTAGAVNLSGLFAFAVLTTNVTGHVAYLAMELVNGNMPQANIIQLWVFSFFGGSFFSSLLIDYLNFRNSPYAHSLPILLEAGLLAFIGIYGSSFHPEQGDHDRFVGLLLFAMGMQNSIVSVVSGAVVRTSHLTGMFTDLGINLSRMIFSTHDERLFLNRKITLHLAIVLFFFLGGLTGGFLFSKVGFYTFFLPATVLILALSYDMIRVNYFIMRRRLILFIYRNIERKRKISSKEEEKKEV